MDEEDGRLGARARQPGRSDALTGAETKSLCSSYLQTASSSARTATPVAHVCPQTRPQRIGEAV